MWTQSIKEAAKGMIDGNKCKGHSVRFFGFKKKTRVDVLFLGIC
ncbi:hypothetical protein COLO4_06425 [Corchorus olitorius]|uniref:Uncharacterized protein n=1 Tax=Corchorus olitorius TaxID=93759 RepID=A0A1R3KN53_9ROSI|nr:hypothetical protein COLO4_06425 [Corchorus olitorius]